MTDTPSPRGEPASEPVVLIANAQEWASRALESALRPAGYEVVKAFNERDALHTLQARAVDAVILDTSFGEQEVLNLCRVLRADARLPAAAPILVTTAGPLTQMAAVVRAGGNGAWAEPIDPAAFLEQLGGMIRAKRKADQQP